MGFWSEFGTAVGNAYGVYAFLEVFGCLGPHPFFLLFYLLMRNERTVMPKLAVFLELHYGFLNPLVYLLAIQPAFFRSVSPPWLTGLCWSAFALYWAFRIWGDAAPFRTQFARKVLPRLLSVCMLLVIGVGLRDLVAYSYSIDALGWAFTSLFVSPLYVFPIVIAFGQLALIRQTGDWTHVFMLRGWPARLMLFATLLLAGISVAGALAPKPQSEIRERVLANRDRIELAARTRSLDPRLLAALISVMQREHTGPFRTALEEAALGAWASDDTSYLALRQVVNPSVGLTQIKPGTARLALWLYSAARERFVEPGTCLETAPPLKEWERPPACGADLSSTWVHDRFRFPAIARRPAPKLPGQCCNQELTRALVLDDVSVDTAAFLIDLYATQWETVHAQWSIREQPEILATLYQIGLERSHPKANPRPNEFGIQVAEEMKARWIVDAFPER